MTTLTWMSYGACRGEDPGLFFPRESGPSLRQIERTQAICTRCLMLTTCPRSLVHLECQRLVSERGCVARMIERLWRQTSCMPCLAVSSDDIALGRITAGQADIGV